MSFHIKILEIDTNFDLFLAETILKKNLTFV